MKVLIIDDEKLDLFIAKKLLEPEFEAEGFTKPADAMEWARSNNFEATLIDYYLDDGVLGIDMLKQLRQIKGNSFKAILLSNHVEDDQAKEVSDAGFGGIIFKPITLEKFKAALQAAK